jgi:hypothetical protein
VGPVILGVDIGQVTDPTALVLAEPQEIDTGRKIETLQHGDGSVTVEPEKATLYDVRFVSRLRLRTRYEEVASRIAEVVGRLRDPRAWGEGAEHRQVHVLIDSTGVGRPIVDLVRAALLGVQRTSITAATITATDHAEGSLFSHEVRVGKQYLASRLATLIEQKLIVLPESEEARALMEELKNFQQKVSDAGRFGAEARTGHDDLVIALGLAVLFEPRLGKVRFAPSIFR